MKDRFIGMLQGVGLSLLVVGLFAEPWQYSAMGLGLLLLTVGEKVGR